MVVDQWGRPTLQGGLGLAKDIYELGEMRETRNERGRERFQQEEGRKYLQGLHDGVEGVKPHEDLNIENRMQIDQAFGAHQSFMDQEKQKKTDEIIFEALAQGGSDNFQNINDVVSFAGENDLSISAAFRSFGKAAEQLQGSREVMQVRKEMQVFEEQEEYSNLQYSARKAVDIYADGRKDEAMRILQDAANSTSNPYQLETREDGLYDMYFDEPGNLNDPKPYAQGVTFEEVAGMIQQTSLEQFDAYVQAHTQMVTEHNREALNDPLVYTDEQGGQFRIYDIKASHPGMEDIIIVQNPQGQEQVFANKKDLFAAFPKLRSTEELKRFWDTQKSMADTQDKREQTKQRGLGAEGGAGTGTADTSKPIDSQRLASVVDPVLASFEEELDLSPQDGLSIRADISRLHQEGMEIHQALEQVLMRRIENMPDMPIEEKKDLRDRFYGWIWGGVKRTGEHAFTALQGSPYGQAAAGLGLAPDTDQDQAGSEVRRPIQRPAQASPPSMPPDARQAPDGKYYVPDPDRPGKYLEVR